MLPRFMKRDHVLMSMCMSIMYYAKYKANRFPRCILRIHACCFMHYQWEPRSQAIFSFYYGCSLQHLHSPNSCHGNILLCQDEKAARLIFLMHEWTRETSKLQSSPEFAWHHCEMQFLPGGLLSKCRLHTSPL